MESVLKELGVNTYTSKDEKRKDAIVIVKTKHTRKLECYKREGRFSIEFVPLQFPYQLFGSFANELINIYSLAELVETIKKIRILSETSKTPIVLYDEEAKAN